MSDEPRVIAEISADFVPARAALREGLATHRKRFDFSESQWWLIEQVVEWIEPAERELADTPKE